MTAPTAKIVSDKTAAYIDFMNVNIYTKIPKTLSIAMIMLKSYIYDI